MAYNVAYKDIMVYEDIIYEHSVAYNIAYKDIMVYEDMKACRLRILSG